MNDHSTLFTDETSEQPEREPVRVHPLVLPLLDSVIHGNCLEELTRIPEGSIDAVVSDPPFTMAGGLSNGRTSTSDSQFFEHWFADVCSNLIRVIKDEGCMFFWCDWRTVNVIERSLARASERYSPWYVSQMIVHDRQMVGMGSPFRNQCDWIAVVRGQKTNWNDRIPKTTPNIFSEYSYYGKHENHPAEKTESAARRIVEWATDEGEIVLDPFAGSGTTCVAAREARRRFIGIEKEEEHVNTCEKRLSRGTLAI